MQEELSVKTLSHIFQHDPESILGFIQKKVLQLQNINLIWQQEMPTFAPYSRVANFREHCLVLEIENAAWATRLRYLQPELIPKLKKHVLLSSIKQIEWYIQPSLAITTSKKSRVPLSTVHAQLLFATADNIPAKSLKDALTRLAKNSLEAKTPPNN